ncbi:DUF438 domain-containing protein [Gudongella oleilytica]|uniref:DUF438 domain-containing protein n=1 Tax=Gudongella oleilytica TaxID=1582259 RepID=UPI002A362BBE|nr:DUF438 domain-containing protein [Gudongella oleilytica]MDY0257356.1 DUF438 domain-containing protein [Gudongella oleilytica]
MSELIDNRRNLMSDDEKQDKLKEVIQELHAGKTVAEVKAKFADVIAGVSPVEISRLEVQLVKDGLPIEEIQNLCDVHAEVFKGSLEEYHHPEEVPGHPVYTMKQENEALRALMKVGLRGDLDAFKADPSDDNRFKLLESVNLFYDIDKHYSRKENLIFPFLEAAGVTAPPKVMWGVDDEIRQKIKDAKKSLVEFSGDVKNVEEKLNAAIVQAGEMIFKEESILFPMCLETLSEDEWIKVYEGSDEIGYTLIPPQKEWELKRVNVVKKEQDKGITESGFIRFDTGVLSAKELNLMLNHMPVDFTFVDKDNVVKYFSNGKERIFARTKAIIGRTVENCHPPKSAHIVEKLVEDLKSGKKDSESFWIQMGDKFVVISYYAVRDENGEFMGTLEFSQDIAPLKALEGEKRLMSE